MGLHLCLGLDLDQGLEPHLDLHLELDSDPHLDLHLHLNLEHTSFAKDGGDVSDPPAPQASHGSPRGCTERGVLTPPGVLPPSPAPGSLWGKAGVCSSRGSSPGLRARGGTKWQRSRWPWLLLSGASGAERAPRRS